MRLLLFLLLITQTGVVLGQHALSGKISSAQEGGVAGVNILLLPDSIGTVSGLDGTFRLTNIRPGNYDLRISHIRYVTLLKQINLTENLVLDFTLEEKEDWLEELNIVGSNTQLKSVNSVKISTDNIRLAPVPFQDISNVLATLPSVTSNNELSTAYSVRGGSYDENLVLVNGIPVYRPFLVRAGQEEGLSFVNTDLVSAVEFSAGGWPVIYDDKMASVLSATYEKPTDFAGSAMASLLGAKLHLEGKMGEKLSFLAGVRHKRAAYLLNTLDVDGDYQPRFTDVQTLLTYQLSPKTKLALLYAFGRNFYSVKPSTSETSFGTFNNELRLQVAFDGQQAMKYQTNQGAIRLTHDFSSKLQWNTMISASNYQEIENIDLEGGYRLCDVDKNLGSDTFNECILTRGIGTLYDYSRNRLNAGLIDAESSLSYSVNASNHLNIGLGYSNQNFEDEINEYQLIDSADYVTPVTSILATHRTKAHLIKFFAQHTIDQNNWTIIYGARANYNTLNNYLLISPRILINHTPAANDRWHIKFGAGLYGQQPFYKEFRNNDGTIITDIKGQSSVHANLGVDYDISWWGRPFQLTTEVYYKYLWNQVPYIIENVRQQYFPNYTAIANSIGFEARLGGEFIPGTESWFSFGLMSAREKIDEIDEDFVRRPTDQRFKIAFLFEDHIPGDPTLRVNLSFQYGSGLPIGPPDDLARRNSFAGDDYSRLDIGFSKIINFDDKFLKFMRLGVEVNNLLGSRNAVSYTWIRDVSNQQFAVPNYLTGRLFNIVLNVEF
jgi:hypothetical protein